LIFQFDKNEYFENTVLEKTYYISNELLLSNIVSSKINWKEGKNVSAKKVNKMMKNKSTYKTLTFKNYKYIFYILNSPFRDWRSKIS